MARSFFAALLALFGASRSTAAPDDVATQEFGPFTIEGVGRRISTGAFPNNSGNPFATMKISSYRVLYHGKPLSAKDAIDLTDGTDLASGPEGPGERFWDVRSLDGAPRPALIAGHTGMWLIDEDAGKARVRMLAAADSNIASWQWLDEKNGQPGDEHLVTLRDSSAEPRSIGGGKLLLVNHTMLLDVATLTPWPLRINSSEYVRAADEFNAGGLPVRALSPSRRQLVYIGSRNGADGNEWGLVVADYQARKVYALAIDAEPMDFIEPSDFNPRWFDHFYEWRDVGGAKERLVRRADPKPWPRQGRFVDFGQEEIEYRIPAIDERMQLAFQQFIEALPGCKRTAADADGSGVSYLCDGKPFRVWRNEHLLDVYVERPGGVVVPGTGAAIRSIGDRFNALLATGKHQGLFLSSEDMEEAHERDR